MIELLAGLLPGVFGNKDFISGAVDQVKSFFGVVDEEDLKAALSKASEADLARLGIQLEQYKIQQDSLRRAAELDVDLRKAAWGDVQSARTREVSMQGGVGNRLMYALAVGVLLVNIALIGVAFFMPSSLDHPGIMALVGAHTSAMTLVLSYFFGSSVPGNSSFKTQ